jgi:hypothetical protein
VHQFDNDKYWRSCSWDRGDWISWMGVALTRQKDDGERDAFGTTWSARAAEDGILCDRLGKLHS